MQRPLVQNERHSHSGSCVLCQPSHLRVRPGRHGWDPKPPGSNNTYGSEGPARVDIPGGNILLPLGTRIQLSGDILRCGLPAAFISEPGDDAESLTLNWVGYFIKEVGVPDDCISFSWTQDDSGGYVVSVIFLRLTPERLEDLTRDFVQVCLVCAGPCDDKDDPVWGFSSTHEDNPRALNCIKCIPCFLCDRCKAKTK